MKLLHCYIVTLLKTAILFAFIFVGFFSCRPVLASELDEFNRQIQEKQETIKKIEEQIEIYKKNIQQKQTEAVTLANQVNIFNSQIAKTELDIRITEVQIEELELEIQSLNALIKEKQLKIEQQQIFLSRLLKVININDQKNYLGAILGAETFSQYFDQIKYVENVSRELNRLLKQIKTDKEELQKKQEIALKKKENIEKLKKTLIDRRAHLTGQKQSKDYLLTQTKASESKFKILLAQLRQEYSQFDKEIFSLQRQVEKKLVESEEGRGGPLLFSWPVSPSEGITVYFRDPTYPFRYLFEHSGIDIRTPQGTPVTAVASGYVAWVRSSRLYGNNVMIVHSNGLATLSAHLSRFNVKEDTFVKRGEIIGWSGGMPGTPGAGFSTGPHLHFEARDNGLPVDPLGYLR